MEISSSSWCLENLAPSLCARLTTLFTVLPFALSWSLDFIVTLPSIFLPKALHLLAAVGLTELVDWINA